MGGWAWIAVGAILCFELAFVDASSILVSSATPPPPPHLFVPLLDFWICRDCCTPLDAMADVRPVWRYSPGCI